MFVRRFESNPIPLLMGGILMLMIVTCVVVLGVLGGQLEDDAGRLRAIFVDFALMVFAVNAVVGITAFVIYRIRARRRLKPQPHGSLSKRRFTGQTTLYLLERPGSRSPHLMRRTAKPLLRVMDGTRTHHFIQHD
jgi:hypothetical protein